MLGETGASRGPGAGDNDDHDKKRNDTVRVTVRKPDGGEVSMSLGRRDSVAQLRAMIRWCWANNHWEYHAIPREIRQRDSVQPGKPEKPEDEMWTLNEQADDCLGLHDDADAPEDLEDSHRRANGCDGEVIENAATGHIEILHGPVMLQDGWLICECGVEDGSFLHPLYTLRGGGGAESRSWTFTAAQLPWCDREWYRAGTNLALAAASSWWAAPAPPPRPSAERPRATEVQDRCLRFQTPTTDDQLPGLFGSGPRANGDDDCAL
jgi:hypothetical protein